MISVSGPDELARRVGVRLGAALVRRHDRLEREPVGAARVEELAHAPGDVVLAAPGQAVGRDLGVHRLDQGGGRAHRVELLGILDHAQALDEAGHRHEAGMGVGQDLVALDRELGRLEADPGRAARELREPVGGRADDVALGQLDVDPRPQRLGGRLVAEVGQERGRVGADDHERIRAR